MSAKLERLTEALVTKAESGGKTAGWHSLCSLGYLPAEIAVFASHAFANDIRQAVRNYAERNELPVPASCARSNNPREARAVLDWREAFRGHVMRTGMNLSLTQPMLEFLCATADGVQWDRSGRSTLGRPDHFIVSAASLEKRGLIKRREGRKGDENSIGTAFHELTEAGQCVVELLKVTGVFAEADLAIEKRVSGSHR